MCSPVNNRLCQRFSSHKHVGLHKQAVTDTYLCSVKVERVLNISSSDHTCSNRAFGVDSHRRTSFGAEFNYCSIIWLPRVISTAPLCLQKTDLMHSQYYNNTCTYYALGLYIVYYHVYTMLINMQLLHGALFRSVVLHKQNWQPNSITWTKQRDCTNWRLSHQPLWTQPLNVSQLNEHKLK